MDEHTFKVVMWIAAGALALVQMLVGFYIKRVMQQIDEASKDRADLRKDASLIHAGLRKELADLTLSISRTHPTKDDFREFSDKISHQVERGFDTLTRTIESSNEKLRLSVVDIYGKLEKKEDRK